MAGDLRARLLSVLLCAGVLGLWPQGALAQACAMCVTTIGGAEDPLAKAIRVSILFMMSMPFLMFGSVVAWIAFMHRRSRGNGAEPGPLQEKEGAL